MRGLFGADQDGGARLQFLSHHLQVVDGRAGGRTLFGGISPTREAAEAGCTGPCRGLKTRPGLIRSAREGTVAILWSHCSGSGMAGGGLGHLPGH